MSINILTWDCISKSNRYHLAVMALQQLRWHPYPNICSLILQYFPWKFSCDLRNNPKCNISPWGIWIKHIHHIALMLTLDQEIKDLKIWKKFASIREEFENFEKPYLWDGIRYQDKIFRMYLSYIYEHFHRVSWRSEVVHVGPP